MMGAMKKTALAAGCLALVALALLALPAPLPQEDDEEMLEARFTLTAHTEERQGEGQQLQVTTSDYTGTGTVRLLLYTDRLDMLQWVKKADRLKPFAIASGSSTMRGYREGETILTTRLPKHRLTWSMKSQTVGPIGFDKRGPTHRSEGSYEGDYYLAFLGIRYEPAGTSRGELATLIASCRATLRFGGAGSNPNYVKPKSEYWDETRKAWIRLSDPGRLEPRGFVPLGDGDNPCGEASTCTLPFFPDPSALVKYLRKPKGTRSYSLKGSWSQENGGTFYKQEVTLNLSLNPNPALAPLD